MHCHTLHNDQITGERAQAPVFCSNKYMTSNPTLKVRSSLRCAFGSHMKTFSLQWGRKYFSHPEGVWGFINAFCSPLGRTQKTCNSTGEKTEKPLIPVFLAFTYACVAASDAGSEPWRLGAGPACSGATSQASPWWKSPTSFWALAVRTDVLLRKFANIGTTTSWRKRGLIQNLAVLPLPLWKVINIKCYNHGATQSASLGTEGKGQRDSSDTAQTSPGLSACMRRRECMSLYTSLGPSKQK